MQVYTISNIHAGMKNLVLQSTLDTAGGLKEAMSVSSGKYKSISGVLEDLTAHECWGDTLARLECCAGVGVGGDLHACKMLIARQFKFHF